MTATPSTSTLEKHELTDAECDVLTDIFEIAQEHSHECREARRAYREAVSAKAWDAPDLLNTYEYAIAHLCAAIAPAALARTPVLSPLDDGGIIALQGEALEKFLRPIFDEAGIGDSFVP